MSLIPDQKVKVLTSMALGSHLSYSTTYYVLLKLTQIMSHYDTYTPIR